MNTLEDLQDVSGLRACLRRQRLRLLVALTLALVLSLVQLLKPFPVKYVIDALTGKTLESAGVVAGVAAGGLLGIQVMSSALLVVLNRVQCACVAAMIGQLRETVFGRLLNVPLRQQADWPVGESLHRLLRDSEGIWDLIMFGWLPMLQASTFLLGMAAVMMWVDPRLGAVALAVTFPLYVMTRFSYRRIEVTTTAAGASEGGLYAQVGQAIGQRLAIAALALQGHECARFRETNRQALQQSAAAFLTHITHSARADLLLAGGGAAVLVVGVVRVLERAIGLGDVVLFISYLAMLYEPLSQLSLGSGRVANARAQLARVEQLAAHACPLPDGTQGLTPTAIVGYLSVESVQFSYGTARPVFRGLSFAVQPGEHIALVGRSGGGKSTLLSLLLRLDDPDGGRILLDGHDLRSVRLDTLRRCMALAPQMPAMFFGTVRDNLLRGDCASNDDKQLARAVEVAGFAPVLARLPLGLDQPLGERGQGLSEGERQRLGIARLLLRPAPVVLLDEPTSALDAASEAQVIEGLAHACRGRTMVLVSHRPAPLELADRILLLGDGQVVDEGTWPELSSRSALFRSLCGAHKAPYRSGDDPQTFATH